MKKELKSKFNDLNDFISGWKIYIQYKIDKKENLETEGVLKNLEEIEFEVNDIFIECCRKKES